MANVFQTAKMALGIAAGTAALAPAEQAKAAEQNPLHTQTISAKAEAPLSAETLAVNEKRALSSLRSTEDRVKLAMTLPEDRREALIDKLDPNKKEDVEFAAGFAAARSLERTAGQVKVVTPELPAGSFAAMQQSPEARQGALEVAAMTARTDQERVAAFKQLPRERQDVLVDAALKHNDSRNFNLFADNRTEQASIVKSTLPSRPEITPPSSVVVGRPSAGAAAGIQTLKDSSLTAEKVLSMQALPRDMKESFLKLETKEQLKVTDSLAAQKKKSTIVDLELGLPLGEKALLAYEALKRAPGTTGVTYESFKQHLEIQMSKFEVMQQMPGTKDQHDKFTLAAREAAQEATKAAVQGTLEKKSASAAVEGAINQVEGALAYDHLGRGLNAGKKLLGKLPGVNRIPGLSQ